MRPGYEKYENIQDGYRETDLDGIETGVSHPPQRRPWFNSRTIAYCAAGMAIAAVVVLAVFIAVSIPMEISTGPPLPGSLGSYNCPTGYNKQSSDLVFFLVGDWGREGNSNQQRAAAVMTKIGDCMRPDFIISTGDNFYERGMSSADDPTFKKSFSNVYTGSSLQVPWYAVLGNHDYGNNPQWQTSSFKQELDSRWHCTSGVITRSFLNGTLDIIMIDTNPFMSHYYTSSMADVPGGISTVNATQLQATVVSALEASTAPYKFVVGHHPVYSYGEHCTTTPYDCAFMRWLAPLLEQHKVMVYANGHEHDLQVIQPSGSKVTYLVSGAGSDTRPGEFPSGGLPSDAKYGSEDQGFMAVVMRDGVARLYVYRAGKGDADFEMEIRPF